MTIFLWYSTVHSIVPLFHSTVPRSIESRLPIYRWVVMLLTVTVLAGAGHPAQTAYIYLFGWIGSFSRDPPQAKKGRLFTPTNRFLVKFCSQIHIFGCYAAITWAWSKFSRAITSTLSLVPRPLPRFQCYTQKRGRAWEIMSRAWRHNGGLFNERGWRNVVVKPRGVIAQLQRWLYTSPRAAKSFFCVCARLSLESTTATTWVWRVWKKIKIVNADL